MRRSKTVNKVLLIVGSWMSALSFESTQQIKGPHGPIGEPYIDRLDITLVYFNKHQTPGINMVNSGHALEAWTS